MIITCKNIEVDIEVVKVDGGKLYVARERRNGGVSMSFVPDLEEGSDLTKPMATEPEPADHSSGLQHWADRVAKYFDSEFLRRLRDDSDGLGSRFIWERNPPPGYNFRECCEALLKSPHLESEKENGS